MASQLFQLSSVCKLPQKPRNLAARQAAVWRDLPHNVANYEALANVLIDNQYISFALDDNWSSGRFRTDERCFSNTYDPSLGYAYDYWTPRATEPVDQNLNIVDSRMQAYDEVDPLPRRLATAHSFLQGHKYSWQR